MRVKESTTTPTWVKLLGIQLELWDKDIIKDIGSLLEMVILVDVLYKTIVFQIISKVLVEIDVCGSLFDSFEVLVGEFIYTKALDYMNISCRCA